MHFKKRPGFSFLDIMMYVSLVALSLHYAIPSYRLLISKIQSQAIIQETQQAQLQLYEHFLLTGNFPPAEDFDLISNQEDYDLIWDGQTLVVTFFESSKSAQPVHLKLAPLAEDYKMTWSCDYDGSSSMKTYLCYALA